MNAVRNIPRLAAVIQLAAVRWEVAVVAGSDSVDRVELVEIRSWLCSEGYFYLCTTFGGCRNEFSSETSFFPEQQRIFIPSCRSLLSLLYEH